MPGPSPSPVKAVQMESERLWSYGSVKQCYLMRLFDVRNTVLLS